MKATDEKKVEKEKRKRSAHRECKIVPILRQSLNYRYLYSDIKRTAANEKRIYRQPE